MHPKRQPLAHPPQHQLQGQLLAAGDGKATRVGVVEHDRIGRVAHGESAPGELVPAREGKAKLEQVHPAYIGLLETGHERAHLLAGARDNGHLDHDVVDERAGARHVFQHALLQLGRVVELHRKAHLGKAGLCQALRRLLAQQVARGVHAHVRARKCPAGRLEKAHGLVYVHERLAARQRHAGKFAARVGRRARKLGFPGAALREEGVVVGQIAVEAEIAVAVALERGRESLRPAAARALDAGTRQPARDNRGSVVSEDGARGAQSLAQLGAARTPRPRRGKLYAFCFQRSHVALPRRAKRGARRLQRLVCHTLLGRFTSVFHQNPLRVCFRGMPCRQSGGSLHSQWQSGGLLHPRKRPRICVRPYTCTPAHSRIYVPAHLHAHARPHGTAPPLYARL